MMRRSELWIIHHPQQTIKNFSGLWEWLSIWQSSYPTSQRSVLCWESCLRKTLNGFGTKPSGKVLKNSKGWSQMLQHWSSLMSNWKRTISHSIQLWKIPPIWQRDWSRKWSQAFGEHIQKASPLGTISDCRGCCWGYRNIASMSHTSPANNST